MKTSLKLATKAMASKGLCWSFAFVASSLAVLPAQALNKDLGPLVNKFEQDFAAKNEDAYVHSAHQVLDQVFSAPLNQELYRSTLEAFALKSEESPAFLELMWRAQLRWTGNYQAVISEIKARAQDPSAWTGLAAGVVLNVAIRTPALRMRYLKLSSSFTSKIARSSAQALYASAPAAGAGLVYLGTQKMLFSIEGNSFNIPPSPAEILGIKLNLKYTAPAEEWAEEFITDYFLLGMENSAANFVVEKSLETPWVQAVKERLNLNTSCTSTVKKLSWLASAPNWVGRGLRVTKRAGLWVNETIDPASLIASLLLTEAAHFGVNSVREPLPPVQDRYLKAYSAFEIASEANVFEYKNLHRNLVVQTVNFYRALEAEIIVVSTLQFTKGLELSGAALAKSTADYNQTVRKMLKPEMISLFSTEYARYSQNHRAYEISPRALALSEQSAGLVALRSISLINKKGAQDAHELNMLADDYNKLISQFKTNGDPA